MVSTRVVNCSDSVLLLDGVASTRIHCASAVLYFFFFLFLFRFLFFSSSFFFFFQAEDGIRDLVRSRGLGDVYKRQDLIFHFWEQED